MSSTIDPKFTTALAPNVEPGHKPHKQKTVDQGVGVPDDNDDDVVPQHGHASSGKGDKAGGKGASTKAALGQAGISAKHVQALALAGLSASDSDSVTRGGVAANPYSADSSILQKSAPLPPDASMPNARTNQLFTSMSQDVSGVLGQTQTPDDADSKAALHQMGTALTQLSQAPANSQQAKVAQQGVTKAVGSLTQRIGLMLNSLASGDAMAAFLLLAVENKSSGKEVDSALQDLVTQGRNTALKQQVAENNEANDEAVKAAKKAALLKKLGPIIDLIVTAIMLAFTALTAGAGGPLAMAVIGAVMGFMVGGIAGGAKNHDGFDLAGAATGAGIGSALLAPMKEALKLIAQLAVKLAVKLGTRAPAEAAGSATTKALLKEGSEAALAKGGETAAESQVKQSENNLERAMKQRHKHQDDIDEARSRPKVESTDDDALVTPSTKALGKRAIDKVAAASRKSAESLREASESVFKSGKDAASDFADAARNPVETSKKAARSISESVTDSIQGYRDSLSSLGSDMAHNAKDLASNPLPKIGKAASDMKDSATLLLKDPKAWAAKIDENPMGLSDKTLARINEKAEERMKLNPGLSEQDAQRLEIKMHSSRVNKMASVATGAMQISNQLTQAVQNYVVTMQQADAKEHMANAKEWKVVSDMLQDIWQTIQDNLSNIVTNHSQVVQQATQMLNSHNQANNNVIGGIGR